MRPDVWGGKAEISAELFGSKFQVKGWMYQSKTMILWDEGFTELAMG